MLNIFKIQKGENFPNLKKIIKKQSQPLPEKRIVLVLAAQKENAMACQLLLLFSLFGISVSVSTAKAVTIRFSSLYPGKQKSGNEI